MRRMKPLYNGIQLNCTIVSDTHIDEKHPMPWLPKWQLKRALSDAQNSIAPVDAFITVGDTTSRSSKANWELTLDCFKKYKPAKQILLAIGNHDTWNDDGFDAAITEYHRYYETICGEKREKNYFSKAVNGYPMLFLGSDADSGCEAEFSAEQLDWFAAEMQKAAATGKPIFVFCHQSINGKHGLPVTWDADDTPNDPMDGGIGPQSDAIEAIVKQYNNVYFFSGHSHMGLGGEDCLKKNGYASFEREGGLHLINLPSLACGNHHGETSATGIGLQLEVYANKVILRPRSFARHRWNKIINIQNGKPYLEETI